MSWWVYLENDSGPVDVASHEEGGTYQLGGCPTAELNVTYNYGGQFAAAFDGLGFRDALNGKRASDVLPLLERGVEKLEDDPSSDYWASTPGNAGHVLATLLSWARQHPAAVFDVH